MLKSTVCMYACMHVCRYVCLYVYMHVCMDVHVCVYVCMYVCMYICMKVCTYVRIYVCMYTGTCTYVCIYMFVYIYAVTVWFTSKSLFLLLESNGCEDGSVQLVGGTADNEGIVLYCSSGVWVSFSNAGSEWDRPEAQVVCRDLAQGFSDQGDACSQLS